MDITVNWTKERMTKNERYRVLNLIIVLLLLLLVVYLQSASTPNRLQTKSTSHKKTEHINIAFFKSSKKKELEQVDQSSQAGISMQTHVKSFHWFFAKNSKF